MSKQMKFSTTTIILTIVLFSGCDKNLVDSEPEKQLNSNLELPDGFCIVANNEVVIDQNEVERYDYSNHLMYIKDEKAFPGNITEYGEFTVFVDNDSIYSGHLFPPSATSLKTKPTIYADEQSMYKDYIIAISYPKPVWDSLGNVIPDPREDERIVEALKERNQFCAGLSCEMKSVEYISSTAIKVELCLKNNDSINYYYLDKDKMGNNLFHYFTHGLVLRSTKNSATVNETYRHKIETTKPEPWNSWRKKWFSVIKGKESINITISYDNFDQVPPGTFIAEFEYPGLKYQIEKKEDLALDSGLIWLGEINMRKEVIIE